MIINLINDIQGDDDCVCTEEWDPVCGADGSTYSNPCYAECEEVEYYTNGQINNDNPCNPMECYEGQWIEIVIDCAEQMGVPCNNGIYVDPPDGVCCSTCVEYGDSNADGSLNVLDVVTLVNYILFSQGENLNLEIADVNNDSMVNVLDVVMLVNLILN